MCKGSSSLHAARLQCGLKLRWPPRAPGQYSPAVVPGAGGGLQGKPGSDTTARETRGVLRQPGKENGKEGKEKITEEKGEKSRERRWQKKQRDRTRVWGEMNKRQKTGKRTEETN